MPASVDATTKGWMPGAVKIAVPSVNYAIGNRGRKAAVLHLTAGSAQSARARFQNPAEQVSAHFLALKSGVIWQFVSVLDTAFANGLSWSTASKCWVDPQGHQLKPPHAPTWAGLVVPINPNFLTVSVERELDSVTDIPPAAQDDAVVRILQYVHGQFPQSLPLWTPHTTLIGHYEISPVSKPHCPGPLCDFVGIAAAANAPILPLPLVQSYRVKGTAISQTQDMSGPYVGYLQPGEIVAVDMVYANGAFHLKDGRGFCALSNVEGPL